MQRPDFSFRQAQSAFDIVSILQSTESERLGQAYGRDLAEMVQGTAYRFENEAASKCYETLASAALDSAEDAELAVAVLVANDLQRGLWSGDAREFGEAAVERIQGASPKLRSAILRGLDVLEDIEFRFEPAKYLLPRNSRLTRPKEEILPKLHHIARGMDPRTRESVAAADYGYRTEEYLEALNDVLSSEDCRFPKNGSMSPSEVVNLVAYVRDTPGFVNCTALLLANAIPTLDEKEWFAFRWERLAVDYNALPDSVRGPILAGIRYLFEADKDFLCYSGRKDWDPVQTPDSMILPVDL